MSLTMIVFLLIGAWLLVAGAMLWGVLRIARRHHLHQRPQMHCGSGLVPRSAAKQS